MSTAANHAATLSRAARSAGPFANQRCSGVSRSNLPALIKLARARGDTPLAELVLAAQEAGRKYINVASAPADAGFADDGLPWNAMWIHDHFGWAVDGHRRITVDAVVPLHWDEERQVYAVEVPLKGTEAPA